MQQLKAMSLPQQSAFSNWNTTPAYLLLPTFFVFIAPITYNVIILVMHMLIWLLSFSLSKM